MKVYIVIYKHTLLGVKRIDRVFADKIKAEEYVSENKSKNECIYSFWELFEEEVK